MAASKLGQEAEPDQDPSRLGRRVSPGGHSGNPSRKEPFRHDGHDGLHDVGAQYDCGVADYKLLHARDTSNRLMNAEQCRDVPVPSTASVEHGFQKKRFQERALPSPREAEAREPELRHPVGQCLRGVAGRLLDGGPEVPCACLRSQTCSEQYAG